MKGVGCVGDLKLSHGWVTQNRGDTAKAKLHNKGNAYQCFIGV